MYALGHGGPLKVLADVASIGESTLRKYLHLFVQAVVSHIKPIYMPGQPFGREDRAAVQGQFSSRRGLPNVTLACDGSHVPFKSKNKNNLPLQPDVWPFFFFRFFGAPDSDAEHLYLNTCAAPQSQRRGTNRNACRSVVLPKGASTL